MQYLGVYEIMFYFLVLERYFNQAGEIVKFCVAKSARQSHQSSCVKCHVRFPVPDGYRCTGDYDGRVIMSQSIIQDRLWMKVEIFEGTRHFDRGQYVTRFGEFSKPIHIMRLIKLL